MHADAPAPTRPALRRELSNLLSAKALGKSVGFEVRDARTGRALYASDAKKPHTPASTTKLLTATAALTALGPGQRFSTTVRSGPGKDDVTVQAGGDVLLGRGKSKPSSTTGHAGLGTLADKTAAALKKKGRRTVAVHLDTSVFAGPARNPLWAQHSVQGGQVAPIEPLMVDAGRVKDGQNIPRASDPAMAATTIFAKKLEADGITVVGKPTRTHAQAGSTVLARVKSARLSQIVRYMLQWSDNTVAETLGRLVAVQTGRPGSTLGAVDAVTDEVKKLGVDVARVELHDTSGLSHHNRLTAAALTDLLVLAASGKHANLDSLIPSLPVAGLNGTLQYRYGKAAWPGAGLVHAKTGSLFKVSSLAGVVTDASGRMLTFALIADRTPPDDVESTHRAMDAIAARLAECGCAG
nr:D-alanyl-D-alanine carboxypeptidase/D-alanyl-D-alanine-endopeptidase [Spelaeicoccus albus]